MRLNNNPITERARTWLGTPFLHQGRLKKVGVDCLGLMLGVGLEEGLITSLEASTPMFNCYSTNPTKKELMDCCNYYLRPISLDQAQDGDIALIAWIPGKPSHLAILASLTITGRQSVIHVLSIGSRQVIEHDISSLRDKINSFWRYKALTV